MTWIVGDHRETLFVRSSGFTGKYVGTRHRTFELSCDSRRRNNVRRDTGNYSLNFDETYTFLCYPYRQLPFSMLQDNRTDMLECLSVFINEDDNTESDRTEEVILDEHSFADTTLTAVTLLDGTQAFVANNLKSDGQKIILQNYAQNVALIDIILNVVS